MSGRGPAWRAFVEHVRSAPGHLSAVDRAAILDAAASPAALPAEEVREFTTKVAERSYAVTDSDVDRLLADGMTEDQILELIVAAAVGAGDRRWRAVFGQ
jgi:hypothetical protein